MRANGKSSILAVAAFAGVSGLSLLFPTEASAQSINIEGIIRGALQHGCCYTNPYRGGSGAPTRRAKSHSNDDSVADKDKNPDKSKEKDATQVEAPINNVAGRQPSTGVALSGPRSSEPDATVKQAGVVRGNDDQPSFAPSR